VRTGTKAILSGVAPLLRVLTAPGDVLSALRVLPSIANDTKAMAEAMRALPRLERQLREVANSTGTLPDVAERTEVLPGMDSRMATIAGSMPVLVEVQQSIGHLPETMQKLDDGVTKLTTLLDRLMVTLDELGNDVRVLQTAIVPLQETAERFGRIMQRLPGGRGSA
jgi:hypothetical protein